MHVNLSVSLPVAGSFPDTSVFCTRGSPSVRRRSALIKRGVSGERARNSSYESHLALNNPVIYAFDNSQRDAFSNNKVALKDDNNGTLVSLEMKRCLALWRPLFFPSSSFTYCYLFILFICHLVLLRILSKVIDEGKCGVSAPSVTERLPPPARRRQCARLRLLRLIPTLISAGLFFSLSRWQGGEKKNKTCVSCIYLTHFIDLFFLFFYHCLF